MADEKDPRIITPMPQALVDRIDDYRFKERIPSRAEAIRRLIELGLPPVTMDEAMKRTASASAEVVKAIDAKRK